jgi:NAD(P)-dependent dehydrogenase (short-subunit alcohol dehydrogenase family)
MAKSGAFIALFDRDLEAARALAVELVSEGFRARAWGVDVSDEAGMAIRQPSLELALKDWNAVLAVNLTGVFLCARLAARHMVKRQRGCIINTMSIMGLPGATSERLLFKPA